MGNKITFECDENYKPYVPYFYKIEENRNPWVKSMILKPTGLQPIKVVAIMPFSKENKINPNTYDFKTRRSNTENPDEKITIFFKKIVEKKKSPASAEISGELADSIEDNVTGGEKWPQNEQRSKRVHNTKVANSENEQEGSIGNQKGYSKSEIGTNGNEKFESEHIQGSGNNAQFPADNML